MVKSDDHMKRVREQLLSKQLGMERSEKAKKMRELRKFGKKVQQEVAIRRQKEKKDMIDAVKKYRKGQSNSLDFLDDKKDKKSSNNGQTTPGAGKKQIFQPNQKRKRKNEKYGFGGQKKRSKQNSKMSNDDVTGFSARRNAANPTQFKKRHNMNKKSKNRPGKQKRRNMKGKTKS
jgi:rRNA-processing protein EBP2